MKFWYFLDLKSLGPQNSEKNICRLTTKKMSRMNPIFFLTNRCLIESRFCRHRKIVSHANHHHNIRGKVTIYDLLLMDAFYGFLFYIIITLHNTFPYLYTFTSTIGAPIIVCAHPLFVVTNVVACILSINDLQHSVFQ